jgi:hypothetical protein
MVASLPCTPWLPLGFAIACGVAVLVVIPVGVSKKSKTATIALGVAAFAVGLAALILFIVQMQQQCYGSSCCCDGSGSGSGTGGSTGGSGGGGGVGMGGQYGGGGHAGSAKVLTWDPVVAVRDFHSGSAPAEVATTPSHTEPTKEPADAQPAATETQTQAAAQAQAQAAAAVSETVAARLPFWAGLPNPVTMYDERQRMWARPETPEITTRRRQTMLREAAAELRLPRDGSMVPVGPPTVVTADPALAAAVTRTLTEPQLQPQPQP